MINNQKIIVIAGPTASGKSEVANELASKINAEIISADSMQIYKGMDIGTGKISKEEQKVKHWGLDIVEPNQTYSAALFQDYSRKCFKDISNRKKRIILCGGTGFYIRAAIDDYDFPKGEQTNNDIRNKYNKYLEDFGKDKLWELLNSKDPESAKVIHKNNTLRVIRALEILEEGKSYSVQLNKLQNLKQKYDAIFFGLKVDSEILSTRINNRVDKMIELGLIEEVKSLMDKGFRDALTSASAIGYKELVSFFDGDQSLEEAINQIKSSTRRYAKRQRTWFNKDKRINWIDYNEPNVNNAISFIESKLI